MRPRLRPNLTTIAKAVSFLFHPLLAMTALTAGMTLAHPHWLRWDLAVWGFLTVLPAAALGIGVRRGIWGDPDLGNLHERRTFLPWPAGFAATLAGLCLWLPVPIGVRWMSVAVALWLIATAFISGFWKISIHEGATVGAWLLCFLLVNQTLALALIWAPLLVAWARLRLHRHTKTQLLAGAVCAALCVWVSSPLSRV